jgi:hypothetical protein
MFEYVPKDQTYYRWMVDWLYEGDIRWSSPRKNLAYQLRVIRKLDGNDEAAKFRDWLLWIGSYPVKRKIPCH